jgi:DNA-binding NarL/FixJ family response regulator
MDSGSRIRVLLADDHEVVRKGIREFLEEDASVQVVAEVSDGEQALTAARQTSPDVAVLDIQMPRLTGIEVTERLKKDLPHIRVLILTAYDYEPYIFAALQAGADGYILKTARSAELVRAVHTVYEGGSAMDPQVTRRLVEHRLGMARPSAGEFVVERPSEREMDVLRFVVRGLSNREIARQMNISPRTVQGHLANLFDKLGVSNRTEAALLALKLGWVMLDETS